MWLAMGWPCTVTPYSTSVPITRRTLTLRAYDAPPTSPRPEGPPMTTATDRVQAQVDAYNARDIDAFVAPYATDVVITDAAEHAIMQGLDSIRQEYGALFDASPDLRAEILGRVSTEDWVVDHERVSRGGEVREVLV